MLSVFFYQKLRDKRWKCEIPICDLLFLKVNQSQMRVQIFSAYYFSSLVKKTDYNPKKIAFKTMN